MAYQKSSFLTRNAILIRIQLELQQKCSFRTKPKNHHLRCSTCGTTSIHTLIVGGLQHKLFCLRVLFLVLIVFNFFYVGDVLTIEVHTAADINAGQWLLAVRPYRNGRRGSLLKVTDDIIVIFNPWHKSKCSKI